jgi:hypothetical protein
MQISTVLNTALLAVVRYHSATLGVITLHCWYDITESNDLPTTEDEIDAFINDALFNNREHSIEDWHWSGVPDYQQMFKMSFVFV